MLSNRRRTATEETLDIATEDSPPPRREQRDVRSRDREMSRARESVAASTPARSRTQQLVANGYLKTTSFVYDMCLLNRRRAGTDAEDNWGSSSASRATSMEREPSQPRMYTSSSSAQLQRGTQAKPQLCVLIPSFLFRVQWSHFLFHVDEDKVQKSSIWKPRTIGSKHQQPALVLPHDLSHALA